MYKSATIAEVVLKLNTRYFVPAIQRPYVWEEEDIEKLFDSLMKRYPISTFLFWEVPGDDKESREFYRFSEHVRQGQANSEKASLEGLGEVVLVLDGQQRLTSLLVGLKGSFTRRQKYKRKSAQQSWIQRELYFNVLRAPEANEEEAVAEESPYGFEFHASRPKGNEGIWFRVADILNHPDADSFDDTVDGVLDRLVEAGRTNAECRRARQNLQRLWRVVWQDEVICYHTERTELYDKVLDIFVRANSGGERLSKSDLLMSLVTLKWENYDARAELNNFTRRLNDELQTSNDFDRDFVLRASLLLSELPYVFSVSSFTKRNIALMESNWEDIKVSLERAVRLVNEFGLSQSKGNLTSSNSVMPIAHYVFRLRRHGLSPAEIEDVLASNAKVIRTWLISSLFAGVFSGAADNTVVSARRVIDEALSAGGDSFPMAGLFQRMATRGRNATFDAERTEAFLELSPKSRVFIPCLTLLYDQNDWESSPFQRVPIFPHDAFAASSENARVAGLSKDFLRAYAQETLFISNMLLLDSDELNEFRELGYEEWLYTRNAEQRQRHLIPEANSFDLLDYRDFLDLREWLIVARLRELTGVSSGSSEMTEAA